MQRVFATFGLLVLTGSTLACGGGWQAQVRRQASTEHTCPEENIELIGDNGNRLARQANLMVCGQIRVYENVNAGATYVWRERTSGGSAP